jgi:hypothetical protein
MVPVEEIEQIEATGEEPEIVQGEEDGSTRAPELRSNERLEGPA